jgi:acetate kinase
VLGRVDAVVFTGGIGENAPAVRAASCSNLDQLGIRLDEQRNAAAVGREGEIQADESRVKILVTATDEEAAIAADAYQLAAASEERA